MDAVPAPAPVPSCLAVRAPRIDDAVPVRPWIDAHLHLESSSFAQESDARIHAWSHRASARARTRAPSADESGAHLGMRGAFVRPRVRVRVRASAPGAHVQGEMGHHEMPRFTDYMIAYIVCII